MIFLFSAERLSLDCVFTAQSALKAVLGQDTSQAGSLVGPERLRFDFNSPRGMTQEELETVENMLNAWIGALENLGS